MLSRDHYAVLGVAPDADDETIEAAYRRLSRRYHPGLNPGNARAHAAFERIRLAYNVLTDASERQRYDREGRPIADEMHLVGGPQADEPTTSTAGFPELFRRLCDHARRSRPQRGDDVRATVACRLVDAEVGRRTAVEVRRLIPCDECGGRGRTRIRDAVVCSTCGGVGREIFGRGALSVAVACADCNGDGMRTGSRCTDCQGAGLRGETETIVVQIPAGVLDGQEIRVEGLGHSGLRGGAPGNLIVTVRVQDHPEFERQGPHLTLRVPVSVSEAVLGARIRIPTLGGGTASVRIPPGVQSGQKLRVRGHGLEMANGRRGDLIVVADIWIPQAVDEDAKRLIREFGERTPAPARRRTGRATVPR